MIAVAASALGFWIASMLPLMLGAPWHITLGVWAVLTVSVCAALDPDRASALSLTYVAFLALPMADFLLPPRPGFVGGAPGNLAFYPADLLLVAAFVLAAIQGRSLRLPRPFRGFLLLGGAYLLSLLPGVVVSPHPVESWMQWLAVIRAILVAVVVGSLAAGRPGRTLGVMLAGLVVQAGVAAGQQIWQGPLGLSLLGEASSDQLFKYIAPGVGLWRSGGTVGHPNAFATYAVGLLPACAATALAGRSVAYRALGIVSTVAAVISLVWSFSRAAWGVALFSLVLLGVLSMRRIPLRVVFSRRFLGFIVAAGVVSVLSLPAVYHRLHRTETSAADARVALVSVARAMTRAYPISGVGLSQFADRVPEFDPLLALELFRHPVHSIVLLDSAEAGYLGGLASLTMWGGGAALALGHARSCARRRRVQASGMWLGCTAIVLHNAIDWTLRQPAILLLFWLLAAMASSCDADEHEIADLAGRAPA